jgi:hypothetical protein
MDKVEIAKRIQAEEDYIRCPKCHNSLLKFVTKNPDGVEDTVIARLLMMSEEEVKAIYEEAIERIRSQMKDD